MENELSAEIKLINDGIQFSSHTGNNAAVTTDYIPPLGNNDGYLPLELFLISFGTCVSGTILPILRKMRKNIEAYSMKIHGSRRTEHPTGFSKIILEINIKSNNLSADEVEKVIAKAEEKYCPVWAMIKNNVEVEAKVFVESR
jgi:putative redox protein